jgi:hypothetical protein
MERGRTAVTRAGALALAAALLALPGVPASAQSPGAPPAAATPARASKPAAPRPSIQLSPAERQALEAAENARVRPARVEESLAPTADDIKPHPADDASRTRIEQVRVSNRVSEVVVTPAGQSRSYVMQNREGRQPFGTTQMNSGLSVPMFRFEFGRPTPPATSPPPPPAPSPSR